MKPLLQRTILAGLLALAMPLDAVEIVKDNTDATGVTFTGTWTASTSTSGYIGTNYHTDGNAAKGTKSVQYTPNIPATGRYAVYARWTSAANRANNVPLQITYSGGTANLTLNQTANGGLWIFQGIYPLAAGTAGNALISNTGTSNYVIADAILFASIDELVFESEQTARSGSSDSVSLISDTAASNGAFEKLNANAVSDYVDYTVPVATAGTYVIQTRFKSGQNRGNFQLSVAGTNQGAVFEQYGSLESWTERDFGSTVFATSGNKSFRFTVTGKNTFSSGYELAFDLIKLIPALRSEAESIATAVSSDTVTVFSEAAASNGSAEKLDSNAVNDYVTYTLPVAAAGTYGIKARFKTGGTRGQFQLSIDGVNQGSVQDQYAAASSWVEVDLGTKTFATAGNKLFKFTVTGKNAASTGYDLTLDYIQLHNTGPDKDADGLPDTWELLNGLNPSDAADGAGDTDGDGQSALQEYLAGNDPRVANGSGGGTITATVDVASGYELEGTNAQVRINRTGGTSAVTVNFARAGVAGTGDYTTKDGNGTVLNGSITLPAGVNTAAIVIDPTPDSFNEYPETATIVVSAGAGYNIGGTSSASVTLYDATDIAANEQVFIAPMTPVPGATTGASGVGTLVLNGPKNQARVTLSFSGLSSGQTNSYLRYGGTGTELRPNMGTGQLSNVTWNIVPAPPYSGQQIIDALFQTTGYAIVNIGTGNYPAGEIQGTWALESISGTYPPPNPPAIATLTGTDLRRDVARFLTQATFGPTNAEIDALVTNITTVHGGNRIAAYNAWIDTQLNYDQTKLEDYTRAVNIREWTARGQPLAGPSTFTNTINGGYKWAWWVASLRGQDQLRQRFAFAASQVFVISGENFVLKQQGWGLVNFYDMLGSYATGNFRDLLESVSKHPAMGQYLSSLRNQKTVLNSSGIPISSPDENYAREIMQLFSIGLVQRRLDGAVQLDSQGNPVETYGNNDIQNLARVFTGWSFGKTMGPAPAYAAIDNTDFMLSAVGGSQGMMGYPWINPMKNFAAYHDSDSKTLLGSDIPAGLSAEADLDAAHDILFNHPSCAPFISHLLIQRFVTSNPSPGYLYRVASKFANNGSGVRGDMKAVLKAILLDYEARTLPAANDNEFGKQKEPVIRFAQFIRSIGGKTQLYISELSNYGYPATQLDNFPANTSHYFMGGSDQLYQTPHFAPSVFNWYLPSYTPGGAVAAAGLVAPEMQISTETQVISAINFFRPLTTPSGLALSSTLYGVTDATLNDIKLDLAPLVTVYDNARSSGQTVAQATATVFDHMDGFLMAGNMKAKYGTAPTPNPRSILIDGVAGMTLSTSTERIQELLYLIVTTPEYIHQK